MLCWKETKYTHLSIQGCLGVVYDTWGDQEPIQEAKGSALGRCDWFTNLKSRLLWRRSSENHIEKKGWGLGSFVVIQLLSPVWLFVPPWTQHARFLCPSLSPRVCSNSCPLSQRSYLTISSSAAHFFCLQSFPASGSFPMSQFFASGGQSIRNSASASVFPMNIQGWFPLGLTALISLLFKGLLRVFPSTTVWKHQFFSTQSFSWSNAHICTWLLEKPQLWLDTRWTFVSKVVSLLFDMLSSFALLSFQGIRNFMAAVTILRGSWSWAFLEGQSE